MPIRKYSGILLLLFFAFSCRGQQLLFNNISNQLGLPAQESYNVMQDSKGFIWISTEAGLCKYNGSYCKLFDKKNGLKENACYAVKEDAKGVLWMLTAADRVLCYENDSLKEASFSEKLASQLNKGLEQIYCINFRNDSVVISTQGRTFIGAINSSDMHVMSGDTACGYYFVKNGNSILNIKVQGNALALNKSIVTGIIPVCIRDGEKNKIIDVNFNRKGQPN
ncbi:MAG TPA: two-component regulator propeller domain-containing protein, partial [Bacteroidia bacterium]|nr:two-component regulator propeller domain-containing protein [Bacteroidia bacterium]